MRTLYPEDMADMHVAQAGCIFMQPFLPKGVRPSGIYIQTGGGERTCHNCEGSGYATDNLGDAGICFRCNGNGRETLGDPQPTIGRVLAVADDVTKIAPGNVIGFLPGVYDWLHLDYDTARPRSFATMAAADAICVFEGYDEEYAVAS
jgi:hypothetical protein